jgi:hypothetical protein
VNHALILDGVGVHQNGKFEHNKAHRGRPNDREK